MCGLEFNKLGFRNFYFICLFTSVFEAFTMVTLRGHYLIDIIFGVIFAHYSYKICDQLVCVCDSSWMKMSNEHVDSSDKHENLGKENNLA